MYHFVNSNLASCHMLFEISRINSSLKKCYYYKPVVVNDKIELHNAYVITSSAMVIFRWIMRSTMVTVRTIVVQNLKT